MQDFFEHRHLPLLLKATVQAAVLILLVLAVRRAFGRRLNPQWRYGLWLLVVIRLAFPWTIPSPVSLFNFLSFPDFSLPIVGARATPTGPGLASSNPTAPVREDQPEDQAAGKAAATTSRLSSGISWLLMVWSAGAFSLAVYLAITHYRIHRRVTKCRPLIDAPVMNLLEDCKQLMGVRAPVTLVETAAVGSPSILGFVRPRLLLPVGLTRSFSSEDLRYVFLHEVGHIKRRDILTGWLITALQILHWFNPLVWFAFHRMRVDRELACDALALSYAKEEESRPYGRTIIRLLEGFGCSAWAPSLAGILEDRNQLKERIRMIATFKKTNRWPAWAILLFAGLGLVTLTDAQTGKGAEGPAEKSSAHEAGGAQAPPHIIATSPAVGATEVDPSLAEISVTFDQEMGTGFSWTGGGPDYPISPDGAKAHWRDRRTCILPVKLEAGRYYRVGINSTSYRNFKNAHGMAAEPSAIYFATQGASEELKLKTRAPKIVNFNPPNGARDVSPALAELRISFSVPMGEGFSWTGGGPKYPKIPDGKRPYWTDDRKTCVLPVALTPGSEYQLGLNSPTHRNFQSASGVPLDPVAYTFKTSEK